MSTHLQAVNLPFLTSVCVPVWLHSALIGKEGVGMSDLLFNTIQEAPMDLRPGVRARLMLWHLFRRLFTAFVRLQFYGSIVLSGGSTMYPGLPTRLETDIRQRYLNEIVKGACCRSGVPMVAVELEWGFMRCEQATLRALPS